MLLPMGLPDNVNVIAWGLSLGKLYSYSNFLKDGCFSAEKLSEFLNLLTGTVLNPMYF
jgi:hypothetical protein